MEAIRFAVACLKINISMTLNCWARGSRTSLPHCSTFCDTHFYTHTPLYGPTDTNESLIRRAVPSRLTGQLLTCPRLWPEPRPIRQVQLLSLQAPRWPSATSQPLTAWLTVRLPAWLPTVEPSFPAGTLRRQETNRAPCVPTCPIQ